MQHSLRIRLTVIFIMLAIGPLLVVALILAQRSFTVERAQALALQGQVAQRVSAEVDSFLREVENDFGLLVGSVRGLEQSDRAQQISLLLGAFTSGTYRDIYEEFALLDDQGQEQLRLSRDEIIPSTDLKNRAGNPEFEEPRNSGQTYFGPVRLDSQTGDALMTIAVPFANPRSVELKGVLVTEIHFQSVEDVLSALRLGDEQTVYIVDTSGQIIAHEDSRVDLRDVTFEVPEPESNQLGWDGTDVVLATDAVQRGDQSLIIVAEQPEATALAAATTTVSTLTIIMIIVLIIASLLGFFVVGQIVRPIEAMSTTAQAISDGDLSKQVAVSSRDELGTLAAAFNSMTAQLRRSIDNLEGTVSDRTQRLEVVATLSEQLSAILDMDTLLLELVNQVKNRFEYYHAHVYVIDEAQKLLVMAAGAGEAGQQMKARGHSIAMDAPTSLVARAARTQEIVKIDNVRETPDWLPNPLLPDTYAEMAVPIILDTHVMGVLDVQQNRIAGLDEGDVSMLRSLANQVAVAIRNARLFSQTDAALAEARGVQEQYVLQSWNRERLGSKNVGRVQYSLDESTKLTNAMIASARKKVGQQAGPAVVSLQPGNDTSHEIMGDNAESHNQESALVAPIKIRDTIIGNLQLHDPLVNNSWRQEDISFIETIMDQVAQAAENLRLFEETQERAARERLIGQIGDRLRSAPNMEALMEIGVSELSKILNPARTFVHFGSQADLTEVDGHVEIETK